jgi:branched-chain amino acid transport system ATP-binding protein
MHAASPGPPLLAVNNAEIGYGGIVLGVRGITMAVPERGCVALLGANGAGKSTTLKGISGLIRTEEGAVSSGSVSFAGERIDRLPPEQVVARGIVHVAEGRRVLQHMTVEQNLVVGGHRLPTAAARRNKLAEIYQAVPRLAALRGRTAGLLSGGEQQLLVIGRALMAEPRLMLIDEPSLGLAPMMVEEVFALLARVRAAGTALLIVEQNARAALGIADSAYVIENGRIVLEGAAAELAANADVREFYLGLAADGARKSYADIKHYRRRKRWLG